MPPPPHAVLDPGTVAITAALLAQALHSLATNASAAAPAQQLPINLAEVLDVVNGLTQCLLRDYPGLRCV